MGPKYYKKKQNYTHKSMSMETNGATYLVIVESPSKCTKIESYLGSQYKCIASKGHIRELNGLKNIDVNNNFAPTFSVIKEKQKHISDMKTMISQFLKKNIILATDDDREGEGIAWHICQVFNLPVETTTRIIFHEITETALKHAISHPQTINMNIVHAQHARQILDVLVGFKISPFLWKHIYSSKTNPLSAGRCQTPALRLIYDNEMERRENKAEIKYKTTGYFTNKNLEFVLGHEFDNKEQTEDFLKRSQAFDHMLTIEKEKESNKSAPKPFNTSRLLQVASNILHTNPKQTMQICQTLYQSGLITYMRTDSTKYAPPFLDSMEKYIGKEFGKNYIGKLDLIKNKDKNNPHEAIRVTDIYVTNIPNKKEAAMYRLIWRNTVESCMSDAKYIVTPLKISAPTINDNNKSKKLFYNHTIEMPIFLGWKQLTTKNMDQDSINGLLLYLKTLQENPIIYSKIESTTVIRNKIQYYTESSLIKKLEDIGIGRPSTFAMIVDTIQERGYVTCNDIKGEKVLCTDFTLEYKKKVKKKETEKTLGNEKSKLQIQPTGELCIQFLTNYFNEMFSYDYTSNMEIELDEIANDENKLWYELCEKCVKEITSLSKKITKIEKEKYPIDEHHEVVFTQYGPSIKKTINDVTTYLKVKDKNISIDKLKVNHYKLEDIIENEPECLGTYDNFPLKIKKGPYGNYLAFGDQKISLKEWKQDICDLTYNDAIKIIESTISAKNKSIVRNINDEMSIRNGKYGHYIFYQTSSMKKPTFFPLKKCPLSYESCEKNELIEWINNSYLKGK